ncbi:voltage-gated potassium channel [Backusella circina FSU 941]|nr:voltage-gated potassium channel [Backusella circina FSU 941]
MRKPHVNLSTVRAKYKADRRKTREIKAKSLYDQTKYYLNNSPYFSIIKSILFAKRTIILFVNLDLLADLVFCLTYLVEMKQDATIHFPGWMFKWRSHNLWLFCLALTCWDLASFSIRFIMTRHPVSVLASFRCCMELLTTVPFIISIFIPHGQCLYVPYFLRSWVLLLRIRSVMKIKINLQITDKPFDPLKTKLIHLVSTIIVLLYNGACAFQYCELTFGSRNYTILDSFYVVMVTLSTVGYGEITPNTEASRIVMMLLIILALAVLPGLLSDVSETIRKHKDGEGHVSKNAIPFILIVGSFTPDQATEILDGFLNTENPQNHLNIIFLDINIPSEYLKLMERNSIWGHRVKFLHGSVLDEKTMLRVEARNAEAIFTISDQNASYPSKEDDRNTVRLWSLHCHTATHNVPIYSYNLSPSTAIYQKVSKEIICVREFKQYLLAMNCRCRGASTLLTNLLHQRGPLNKYDEGWKAQYDDGLCNEIYIVKAAPCIRGIPFRYASLYLYQEAQIILFAIKTFVESSNTYEILINPKSSYIINDTDVCVFIAESPREIEDILDLVKNAFGITQNQKLIKTADVPVEDDSVKKENNPPHSNSRKRPPLSSRSSLSVQSRRSSVTGNIIDQTFCITKLPSKSYSLLAGNRSLIKNSGKFLMSEELEKSFIPSCYLLDETASLDDITIDSVDEMEDHIVVCLHKELVNIFKFIYNLRSSIIRPEDLQDIVLLCSTRPSKKIFDLINIFPGVYFMEGNCRNPEDLLRAGVKRAKQVVVMSEKENFDNQERNFDSSAVMTSHILHLLLRDRPKDSYTIVNLIEKSNIKFIHLLEGKDVTDGVDVFYAPSYASGNIMADGLISNVLLSQTFYKPDIVSVIKAICGIPNPSFEESTENLLSMSHTKLDLTETIAETYLTSMQLPPQFINQTYSELFKSLLIHHGILCIGLLRSPDTVLGNTLPFVYTNPVPSLILKKSDTIYTFAPSE